MPTPTRSARPEQVKDQFPDKIQQTPCPPENAGNNLPQCAHVLSNKSRECSAILMSGRVNVSFKSWHADAIAEAVTRRLAMLTWPE